MEEKLVKIAISGKGGVGKTNPASLLAIAYAEAGYNVIAIDANPDAKFAMAMGVTSRGIRADYAHC